MFLNSVILLKLMFTLGKLEAKELNETVGVLGELLLLSFRLFFILCSLNY